jgi:hypothetical protein
MEWRNLVTKNSHFCILARSLDFVRNDRRASLDLTEKITQQKTHSNAVGEMLREPAAVLWVNICFLSVKFV